MQQPRRDLVVDQARDLRGDEARARTVLGECRVSRVARVLTALTGLVAVVAGLGAGIEWLNNRVSATNLMVIGSVALTVAAGAWMVAGLGTRTWRWCVYAVGTYIPGLVLLERIRDPASHRGLGHAFAAITLVPWTLELYLNDRRSRTRCLDCHEFIRADANVCKHCGFSIRPKPKVAP
jgi:hypothetical protein